MMKISGTSDLPKRLTAALVLLGVVYHLVFAFCAGGLWRDEASSVQQAQLQTWRAVRDSLGHDSFPVLHAALLRLWCSIPAASSDAGLRLAGLLLGLSLMVSLVAVGRRFGSPFPVVLLALVALDPVLIAEGDSIRPYGFSLLLLIWTCDAFGSLAEEDTRVSLAWSSALAVLSVQASYPTAFWVAVFSFCSAWAAWRGGRRRGVWKIFVPGAVAALSLAPYLGPLRRAGEWAGLLNAGVDWSSFLWNYILSYSPAFPLAWLGIGIIALLKAFAARRCTGAAPFSGRRFYCAAAAAAVICVQIAIVQIMGVPPFPRYFLPGFVLLGFALEAYTSRMKPGHRFLIAVAAAALTAAPAISSLRLHRTNVDAAAGLLGREARLPDLVLVDPWYVGPSFQRYYAGPARWTTVPVMPRAPMTRYDLLREAILDRGRERILADSVAQALQAGGSVWLVSRPPVLAAPGSAPGARPEAGPAPSGDDYRRFLEYWDRDLRFQLQSCCRREDVLTEDGGIWYEERLVLTRWRKR